MKFKDLFKNTEDYESLKKMVSSEDLEKFETEFDGKELSVIPYSRFNEVNDKKKEAMDTNDKLKKQIEKLEKERISPEDFQKKSQEIIDGYEKKIKDIETSAYEVKRDYAIKDALAGAKAKHPDLLVKQLDFEKIKEKDGKFEGIDEQIGELKKTYSDLFDAEKPADDGHNGNNGSIYSGFRRQGLSEESSKISEIFKEVAWGDKASEM